MSSVAGTQPLQAGSKCQWLNLILEDHKLFRTFINDRIPALLSAGDKAGLKAARDELSARLSAHTSAEERTYQSSAPAELYAEVLRQDAQEKAVVDRFMSVDYNDIKAFAASFSELQAIIFKHMDWEESVFFPALNAKLSDAEKAKFAADLESLCAGSTLPTRPHPLAGPSATGPAKLMHPLTGLLDRAADKIVGRDVSGGAGGGVSQSASGSGGVGGSR